MEIPASNAGVKTQTETPSSSEKPKKRPASLRLKGIFALAILGMTLSACSAIDSRAQANIDAAGVPPAVAHDPELISYAASGSPSAEEIQNFAETLSMRQQTRIKHAQETQAAIEPAAEEKPSFNEEDEVAQEEKFLLKKEAEGVYSFSAAESIEITDEAFIKRIKASLKDTGSFGTNDVFIAVPDDDARLTRVFPYLTLSNWREKFGFFWIYTGDEVYIATDEQALNQLLDSRGVIRETFDFPKE